MGISYNPLWKLLIDRKLRKGDLMKFSGVSSMSIAKLAKGENVTTEVLTKICKVLAVEPGDIMEMTPEKEPEEEYDNETA